jgi:hypothetical protein
MPTVSHDSLSFSSLSWVLKFLPSKHIETAYVMLGHLQGHFRDKNMVALDDKGEECMELCCCSLAQPILFAIFQLLLSGIMGLLLLCCCHKDYPGMPLGVWMFSLKVRIHS